MTFDEYKAWLSERYKTAIETSDKYPDDRLLMGVAVAYENAMNMVREVEEKQQWCWRKTRVGQPCVDKG